MRTVKESLEIAIQTLCERAGLDLEEGVKGVMETLEANGYVITRRNLFVQGGYVLIAGVDMQSDPQWHPEIPAVKT